MIIVGCLVYISVLVLEHNRSGVEICEKTLNKQQYDAFRYV